MNPNDYKNKSEGYFGFKRPEVVNLVPENAKTLLDVGCGAGAFGKYLKEIRDIEVWGVELSPTAAEKAKENIDKVIAAPFDENANCPEGYFDVITFNDSLEHFPNEAPPLMLAKKLLKPGGVIICSLPNVRFIENMKHVLIERDWKYVDAGTLDRTHLRFFTKKSMLRTFDELGFDVLDIQGINPGYWKGWKIGLLRLVFGKYVEDMKYLQYASVIRPRDSKPSK